MKILNITKRFEDKIYGGVEKLIDNICSQLYSQNLVSDVYTLKNKLIKKRKYNIISDKVLFSFFSCPFSFQSLINFSKIKNNYDIFNFHFPWPFMDILSLFVPKQKIIITYHSDITQKNIFFFIYFPLMILFLYRSKYIIVTSKKYLNSSWVLKLFLSKIKVIPIGIDVSQNNLKKKNIFRKKKYFIFVGNLRNYKGLDFLINAFKILKYNLVILGNGKLLNYVKTEIKNVDNIYHIKNANESTKIQLMRKSLSIILPSTDRRESFGVVLLEASFLKKPLITTNINTGTSFVNLHNKTGFICKPKCQKDIIKYCKIIYENSYLRKKLGKNAHQRYLKYFTKDKMIKKYINLFNQF